LIRGGIGLSNWLPGFSEALWFEQTLIPPPSGVTRPGEPRPLPGRDPSGREGIAKAKAAGKYKRRPISIDVAQIRQLRVELGPPASAKRLGIARSSVYRALA